MVKVDEHSSSKQIPSFLHVDYVDKTSKQELEDICISPFLPTAELCIYGIRIK